MNFWNITINNISPNTIDNETSSITIHYTIIGSGLVVPSHSVELWDAPSGGNLVKTLKYSGVDNLPPFMVTVQLSSVDISDVPDGSYYLEISSHGSTSTNRILVNRIGHTDPEIEDIGNLYTQMIGDGSLRLDRLNTPILNFQDITREITISGEKEQEKYGIELILENFIPFTEEYYITRVLKRIGEEDETQYSSIGKSTEHKIYTSDTSEGLYEYYITAVASNNSSSNLYSFNSDPSNVISFEIASLDRIDDLGWYDNEIDNNIITKWTNTGDYANLKITGTSGISNRDILTHSDEWDLSDEYSEFTREGNIQIVAQAFSLDSFHNRQSAGSDPIYLDIEKLDSPTNLNYDVDTNTLTWTGVNNASMYDIYNGNDKIASTSDTELTYIFDSGTLNVITVVSSINNINGDRYKNRTYTLDGEYNKIYDPIYIDSDPSQSITFGTLSAITDFTRSNDRLQWSPIEGATNYILMYRYSESSNPFEWMNLRTLDGNVTSYVLHSDFEAAEYEFKIKGYAKIEGIDIYSPDSNLVMFTIYKLRSPVLQYSTVYHPPGSGITTDTTQLWFNKLNPQGDNIVPYKYELYRNNIKVNEYLHSSNVPSSSSPAIYNNYTQGEYEFRLKAVGDGSYTIKDSDLSNRVTLRTIRLSTPSTTFNRDTLVLTWGTVDNATKYDIYVRKDDDSYYTKYTSTSSNSYDFGENPYFTDGNFSIYIKAIKEDQYQNANPRYLESLASTTYNFGVLGTPVLSVLEDGITLEWDPINNAEKYEVYRATSKSGNVFTLWTTTNNTSAIVDSRDAETYRFYVWARSSIKYEEVPNPEYPEDPEAEEFITIEVIENNEDDSKSNTVSIIFTKLDTPDIDYRDGRRIMEWYNVPNSTHVELYVNGKYKGLESTRIGLNSLDLTEYYIPGVNSVYIRAINNNVDTLLPSQFSNTIYNNVKSDWEYMVEIDGQSYELWLPIELQLTMDGSLWDASLTLRPIDRKFPFEKDTEVTLYIYADDRENPIYPSPIYLVVEKDNVEEFQIGSESKWKHNVSLVSRERLLQYEQVSSLSIKQHLEAVRWLTVDDYAEIDTNGLSFPVDFAVTLSVRTDNWWKSNYDTAYIEVRAPHSSSGSVAAPKILKNKYSIDDYINIPAYDDKDSFYRTITTAYVSKHNQDHLGLLDNPEYTNYATETPIRYRYYYRLRDEFTEYKYEPDPNIPEIEILDIKNWKPPQTGNYDIIIEYDTIDIKNPLGDDFITLGGLYDPEKINKYHIRKNFFVAAGYEMEGRVLDEFNLVDHTKKFRVIYKDIEIVDSIEKPEIKTVRYALEKLINIIEPTNIKYGLPKYTINEQSLQIADTIICPDIVFENKNMFEILVDLGALFNGVPRLDNNNEIKFDLRDNMNINPDYIDENQLIGINSPVTSYSTSLITDAKNLINEKTPIVYPAQRDQWITMRSNDDTDAWVTSKNAVLMLPFPIKRIHKVLVRNIIPNNPNREIDITKHIWDKKIWDSMSATVDTDDQRTVYHKGNTLYYEEGKNMIYNIGEIKSLTEVNATLGFRESKYVIEEIASLITGEPINNNEHVQKFQFKIWYEPIIDTRLTIERDNVSGLKNKSTKSFNQDTDILSPTMLAQSTKRKLERLSNFTMTKTSRLKSLLYVSDDSEEFVEALPRLGQIKVLDGINFYTDVINFSYYQNYVDAKMNLTSRINKLNERMRPDASWRQYEISQDQKSNRDITTNLYVYIDEYFPNNNDIINKYKIDDYVIEMNRIKKSTSGDDIPEPYIDLSRLKKDLIASIYHNTTKLVPDTLYGVPIELNGDLLSYQNYDGKMTNNSAFALPLSTIHLGNTLSFVAETQDAFSVGKGLETDSAEYKVNLTTYKNRGVQKNIRYVNDYGETPALKMAYIRSSDDPDKKYIDKWLPEAKTITDFNNFFGDDLLWYNNVWVQKESNERLRFQLNIHFKTSNQYINIGNNISNTLYNLNDDVEEQQGWNIYLFKGNHININTLRDIPINENISESIGPLQVYNVPDNDGGYYDNVFKLYNSLLDYVTTRDYDGYLIAKGNNIIFAKKQEIPKGINVNTLNLGATIILSEKDQIVK